MSIRINLIRETERQAHEALIRSFDTIIIGNDPASRIYRLGAGTLFLSLFSLLVWSLSGIGMPFHPGFAVGILPVSVLLIYMAFVVKRAKWPH